MPTIKWNYDIWNNKFDWEKEKLGWCRNDEGNEIDWRYILYPRLYDFIPVKNILEIAPGHGRWTYFLKNYCKELLIVDLAPNCIESCKNRFKNDKHIKYFINDGLDLSFIEKNYVDFIFSFDSLVHADVDVIDSYLKQASMILSKNGVGFFHHSNGASIIKNKNEKLKGGRSTNVSAKIFNRLCNKYKLRCISQEIINWNSPYLIDCLSIFCKKDSKWRRKNKIIINNNFPEDREKFRLFKNYLFNFK